MNRSDAVENLHRCVADLEKALEVLTKCLSSLRLLMGRVFELPPVYKGQEQEPLLEIKVTQYLAQPALNLALHHFRRLFIQHQSESLSTKAAVRLPGAICFEANTEELAQVRQYIDDINNLKRRLMQIITVDSGLASEERFEFVHTHLRGLITLNAYRAITLLEAPDSLRFGWANKHIVKNVSRQEVLDKLKKSLTAGHAMAPLTQEQWAEKLTQEIVAINSLPYNAKLKIKRPVKVQPIARVWNRQQQKQTQLACPSPLLVLCPNANSMPKIGELANYNAEKVKHKFKPPASPLYPVIPRLHLYSEYDG